MNQEQLDRIEAALKEQANSIDIIGTVLSQISIHLGISYKILDETHEIEFTVKSEEEMKGSKA